MNYRMQIALVLAVGSAVACTAVPLEAPKAPIETPTVSTRTPMVPQGQALPCATCAPKPFTAVAVTRPPLCNDYPVTYRVQVPEADDRIKMIDRTELVSSATNTYFVPSCSR